MYVNIFVWLTGLMISAIPVIIVFAGQTIPGGGSAGAGGFVDVSRLAYGNILFMAIAVAGIAIAQAVLQFFKMVEVAERRFIAALWLMLALLVVVTCSISYGRIAGPAFDAKAVSVQQIYLAYGMVAIALICSVGLRITRHQLNRAAVVQLRKQFEKLPINVAEQWTEDLSEQLEEAKRSEDVEVN